MMDRYIYKILDKSLWQSAETAGVFAGAGIDLTDGYIHFSDTKQALETARLHFAGLDGLVLLQVDTSDLDIVWEPSRGGQLFPHLYGVLSTDHVTRVWPLPLDENGNHIFPAL